MSKIVFEHGLPFVTVTLFANGQSLTLNRVLLDTGSGGCIFKTSDLEQLGVELAMSDRIARITGIGGDEFVVDKRIDAIEVGNLRLSLFIIELGAVNYAPQMDGILGVNFLAQSRAVIDFANLVVSKV
jgi:hypothetical protein